VLADLEGRWHNKDNACRKNWMQEYPRHQKTVIMMVETNQTTYETHQSRKNHNKTSTRSNQHNQQEQTNG
jgi:hypothetical protein